MARHPRIGAAVTDELPFGTWLPTTLDVDSARAGESVKLHRDGDATVARPNWPRAFRRDR
jgi:hypothetical protein